MCDFRREPLISLGTKNLNDDKSKSVKRSVRISVTLPESTIDGYPEINFRQELAAWEEKHISNCTEKLQNGLDPLNEDDDDVRRIAQELEVKYGISSKKKRKKRKTDVGVGYDESDSFIDNTDCHDEIIPKNITTLHGGFYINCGALEFKPVDGATSADSSSSSSEDESSTVEKTKKKRPLDSLSESESEDKQKTDQKEKKQKLANGNTNGIQKAIKNKLFSDDKIKKMKKSSVDEDKKKAVVKELVKEKREELNAMKVDEVKKIDVPLLKNVNTVIESVVTSIDGKEVQNLNENSKDSSGSKENVKTVILDDSNDCFPITQEEREIVKLPDNTPSDILPLIDEIKMAAAQNTEGKVKFFQGPVGKTLLTLERKCKTLKKSLRVRIYEHLAPFVRCRKETLIKRAKSLLLEDEKKRVKNLLNQLHVEIQRIMPSLLHNHENDIQKILQKKLLLTNDGVENEEQKLMRMPKRRFTWTEETRKLLKEAVTIQRKCFLLEGRYKEKLDELTLNFLKTSVQILWPEGWMSPGSLVKCCNLENKKNNSKSAPEVSVTKVLSQLTSKSPSLTITAINSSTSNASDVQQKTISEQFAKVKTSLPSDIIISSINLNSVSIKSKNKLVSVSNEVPKVEQHQQQPKAKEEFDELKHIQKAMAEDLSQKSIMSKAQSEKDKNIDNVIMDLTDNNLELKRKPGPKSKTKYYLEDPEKPVKIKKITSDKIKSKDTIFYNKDGDHKVLDNNFSLEKLISNSLSDSNCYKNAYGTSTMTYPSVKPRHNQDGEDSHIQEVLEGLRNLQKMSSPAKTDEYVRTNTPQSVIAYNSKSSSSASTSPGILQGKNDPKNLYSDAFQKQFIQFNMLKANQSNNTPTTTSTTATSASSHNSKNDLNSVVNNFGHSPPQKDNNAKTFGNYPQPYFNNLFSNINCPPQGSFNMLQDMFANLLKESSFQTVADKSNIQQK